MKTTILILAIMISSVAFGQDSIQLVEKNDTRIFTVNPSLEVRNTAGINVGILDDYEKQTINGLNLQANPISLIYFLFPKSLPVPSEEQSTATINGLHLSTGGMMDGEKLNGVGISAFHHARITNGLTLNIFNNTSGKLNGLHISGFYNEAEIGNGLLIAIGNDVEKFNGIQIGAINSNGFGTGLQIGIFNKSKRQRGLQVGLVNKTEAKKGFQIGFWNKNAKRTLPLINF